MTKLATKTLSTSKRETKKTNKTEVVTWSKSPQPVYQIRNVDLTGEVTLEIDVEKLLSYLGPKALRSKGRKAIEASGAVVVTARVTSSKPGEWR